MLDGSQRTGVLEQQGRACCRQIGTRAVLSWTGFSGPWGDGVGGGAFCAFVSQRTREANMATSLWETVLSFLRTLFSLPLTLPHHHYFLRTRLKQERK